MRSQPGSERSKEGPVRGMPRCCRVRPGPTAPKLYLLSHEIVNIGSYALVFRVHTPALCTTLTVVHSGAQDRAFQAAFQVFPLPLLLMHFFGTFEPRKAWEHLHSHRV